MSALATVSVRVANDKYQNGLVSGPDEARGGPHAKFVGGPFNHPFWTITHKGPSIKYVTLFLATFDPLPLSHFVTHPGTPRKYVTHLGPPPHF